MRHINIEGLLGDFFSTRDGADVKRKLFNAHKVVVKKPLAERQGYIRKNGPSKWTPVKNQLSTSVGNKCWYTEVELVGSALVIDHFRPASNYWWLAFDANNYRVSCPFSNSPKHNSLYGCAGGKGNNFPLLGAAVVAKGKNKLRTERPVILDPCNSKDCELIAFQADGRPVIHPNYASDAIAVERLQKSNLLLNLDHPDFNTKREQLYQEILGDVKEYEDSSTGALSKTRIVERMSKRLLPTAPFSTAARFYLQFHRNHVWVADLLHA